ncbi:MAG: hypothetical protein IJS09_00395 [Treponema sp.]|nr:hypothetical protein [Treponema sp.]
MRLIEVACSALLLTFFTGICASAARPVERLVRESERASWNLSRDRFIADSFRHLCEGTVSRTQIEDWCHLCNGLYPKAMVSVSQAGFSTDGKRIFSCTWNTLQGTQQVLAAQD